MMRPLSVVSAQPVSLRAQLLLSVVCVLIGVLAVGGALVTLHAASKVATEMRAALAVGVRIAHNAVDDVDERSDPDRRLRLLVADFDGDRHVRAVYLGAGGDELASSRLEPPERMVPDWFFELFGGNTMRTRVELPSSFEGHGSFELVTDSHNEVAELWTELCLLIGLLAAFSLSSIAAVLTLVQRAFRPLGALADAFRRIGSGLPVAPLDEAGPVELARIYQGFNRMQERLGQAERRNADMAEHMLTLQEEERADIARDLHDEIGPFLFSVDVDVAAIERCLADSERTAIAQRLVMIRDSVCHMRRHVKDILARLRPAALVDVGLASALEGLVGFWRIRAPGMVIRVATSQDGFGSDIDDALFRVVQESISNAVRHGRPTEIDVVVRQEADQAITLMVSDNGCGIIAAADPGRTGFGITGMHERLRNLGGSLTVANRSNGRGAVVRARLPTPPDASRKTFDAEAACA